MELRRFKKESEVKMEKYAISGQFLRLVPVPLMQRQNGTGTSKVVPVPLTRT